LFSSIPTVFLMTAPLQFTFAGHSPPLRFSIFRFRHPQFRWCRRVYPSLFCSVRVGGGVESVLPRPALLKISTLSLTELSLTLPAWVIEDLPSPFHWRSPLIFLFYPPPSATPPFSTRDSGNFEQPEASWEGGFVRFLLPSPFFLVILPQERMITGGPCLKKFVSPVGSQIVLSVWPLAPDPRLRKGPTFVFFSPPCKIVIPGPPPWGQV